MNNDNKIKLVMASMFMTVGLVMASVLGVFHIKVDTQHSLKVDLPTPYSQIESGFIFKTTDIYLTTLIIFPEAYHELMKKLDTAKVGDRVNIHLAGDGGDTIATIALYNSLKRTRAHITMIVEGDVYSAHAFLSLMGDDLKVGKGVIFMFHHGQHEDVSQYGEKVVKMIAFRDTQTNKFIDELLTPYFRAQDIKTLEDTTNMLLANGEYMQERWNRVKHSRGL